jgi:hypothetical protein
MSSVFIVPVVIIWCTRGFSLRQTATRIRNSVEKLKQIFLKYYQIILHECVPALGTYIWLRWTDNSTECRNCLYHDTLNFASTALNVTNFYGRIRLFISRWWSRIIDRYHVTFMLPLVGANAIAIAMQQYLQVRNFSSGWII